MSLQDTLPAPRTEIFHTEAESFPSFPESILQKLPQHLLLHEFHFPLVCNPERRIQPNLLKMVPQQEQTETVYGGNLGIVQQGSLPLDMLRIRLLLQPGGYAGRNTLPHLRRRSIGEGHHQQTVDIHRPGLITYHPYDAFHQHCCLTAACRRGHQDITSPGIDHFLLFRRK